MRNGKDLLKGKKLTCEEKDSNVLRCLDLKENQVNETITWETLQQIDSITWNGTMFTSPDGSVMIPTSFDENEWELKWYSRSGTLSDLIQWPGK